MFKKLFVAAVLIGLPALGHAAANGTIWNSVAVCDPLYPTHCVAPAADGSIPVTGAGGGGGGTSSNFAATFPTAGTAIGFKDSTGALMAPGRVDASNNLATFLATAIPAGTNVIGHVIADTGSTTAVTGTVAVNQTQMNGVAVSAGNGTTDTGTQRVTLSSDGTGQVALAAGSAAVGTVTAVGKDAKGATATANPVGAGGVYYSSGTQALSNLQRGDLMLDATGRLVVSNTSPASNFTLTDGAGNAITTMQILGGISSQYPVYGNIFNGGTTWDRIRSVVNATNSTGTGIAAAGLVGQFDDVSPQAVTENQFGNLRQDGKGILYATSAPTAAVGAGITPVVSASLESGHVLKASAGNLYSVYAFNSTVTAGFLVVTNTTAVPADGAVTPIDWCVLPASGSCSINNKPGPPGAYSAGISAFVSSNASLFTKTTGVITAAIHGEVQ